MSERSTATGAAGAGGTAAPAEGQPAIFLMCDGVLSERGELLARRLDDSTLLPMALDGLRLLSQQGVPVLALVRRHSAPHDAPLRLVERAHADRIAAELRRRGAGIEAMLFAPEPEENRERACTTMMRVLRLAARQRGIDLGSSLFICDTWTEVEAGLTAGCQPLLVMTGSGRAELSRPQTARVRAQTWYAADLMMAALSVDAHFGSGGLAARGSTLAGFSPPSRSAGSQTRPVA